MSRQEVRDEYKETEGNPAIKSRIRRLQRQAAPRRRCWRTVKRAAVVITNPTAFAVALEYWSGHGGARGSRQGTATCWRARSKRLRAGRAFRWWRIRRWRTRLYRTVEVGQSDSRRNSTPSVAEMLAAIYRAQSVAHMAGRRPIAMAEAITTTAPESTSARRNGLFRLRRSAWCLSCWCRCRRFCSTCCWPSASWLRCWCCSRRFIFCGRRSSRYFPACFYC